MTPELELHAGALMARAQGGDQPAYDELLRLAARDARGFVARRVGAVDWVEDVVQEALITVHKARHTYDPARPFGPWFYAIVHSRLIDVLRSKKRLGSREVADEAVLAAQPAPRAAAAEADVRETLARAVAGLPRVQREIVSLLKYRGSVGARRRPPDGDERSGREGVRASRLQAAQEDRWAHRRRTPTS